MNYTPQKNIGGGLVELPEDQRDFQLGALYKFPKLEEIPDDFLVGKSGVDEDQGQSDLCTAFVVANISEQQEGADFSPEYQFAKTKQVQGEWEGWGADLRSACKSAIHYGSLPKWIAPHRLNEKGRNFIADWENWPADLDLKASQYRKSSFVSVEGPYSDFDNVRAALWMHRNENRQVITGASWRPSWTQAKGGVIPESGWEAERGLPHSFRISGANRIDGKDYLVAPLSNGTDIGEKGVFFIPRSVADKEFKKYGIYTFKDFSAEEVRLLLENGWQARWLWLLRMREWLKKVFGFKYAFS